MVKPNFFILGAPKAGTTALAQILMQHPEAFIPKDKELNFLLACEAESYLALNGFKKITDKNHYCGSFYRGWKWYETCYREVATEKAIGDASVSYFFEKSSHKLLKEYFSDARFIVMLRDPVDRLYSHYQQEVKVNIAHKTINSFEDLYKKNHPRFNYFAKSSHYKARILELFELFNREQFIFILFDDFKTNQERELKRVFEFLDIDPNFTVKKGDINFNPHTIPRSKIITRISALFSNNHIFYNLPLSLKRPIFKAKKLIFDVFRLHPVVVKYEPLSQDLRKEILPKFLEDTEFIEQLLNRDLTHWKV